MPTLSPSEILFGDLERELAVTRKVLECLPMDQDDWQPHAKSMTLGKLAFHVATLPEWARLALAQDELDAAAAPPAKPDPLTRDALLATFDRTAAALSKAAADFDPTHLADTWTMRQGDKIFVQKQRQHVYRIWCLNHLIHHRAQLCVYLRLLNVPVPTVYFNTADDPTWVFE